MCSSVRYTGVGRHQCTYLRRYSPQGMYMCSCLRSLGLFISVGGRGGSTSLCSALFAGVEGYFDLRKIGVFSVFSQFFDGG